MSLTASILKQITDLGYAVSIQRVGGALNLTGRELPVPERYTELHAVALANPDEQHVARVEGDGEEVDYRAACLLAQSVGIDLEDG